MKTATQVEMFETPPNPKDKIWLDVPSSWPPSPPQFCSVCGAEDDNLLMIGDEEVCENEECENIASKADSASYLLQKIQNTYNVPAKIGGRVALANKQKDRRMGTIVGADVDGYLHIRFDGESHVRFYYPASLEYREVQK